MSFPKRGSNKPNGLRPRHRRQIGAQELHPSRGGAVTSHLRFGFRRARLIRFDQTLTVGRAKAIATALAGAWVASELAFLGKLEKLTGITPTRAPDNEARSQVLRKTV